jgi:hypothetical protein
VPAIVVTDTEPDEPLLTGAVIVVGNTTVLVKVSAPPNETVAGLTKLEPVIVTIVPFVPVVGVNEVIVGGAIKVNKPEFTVPYAVVTLMLPVAPVPKNAVITDDETTVNEVAATPPKLTAVVPRKFKPVIVMVDPAEAESGETLFMLGEKT